MVFILTPCQRQGRAAEPFVQCLGTRIPIGEMRARPEPGAAISPSFVASRHTRLSLPQIPECGQESHLLPTHRKHKLCLPL